VCRPFIKKCTIKKINRALREEASGSGINFEGKCLDIRATMCPLGRAIIKLEVWDKMVSPISQQVC